ncbi:hypothetical protein TNCV_2071751 [Trichonephila clavipes]|nr:hypothetical protein TNCV_2071751 [Trichonephila clavipes]
MWQELLTFFIFVLKLVPTPVAKELPPRRNRNRRCDETPQKNENLTGSVNLTVPERKLLVLRRNPSKAGEIFLEIERQSESS